MLSFMTMFLKNYFNIPKCNILIPFIIYHYFLNYFPMFLFSHQVTSNTLWPHELQHPRLPCPSLSLEVCSKSCPLNQWCHLTVSSSVILLLLLLSIFPSSRIFSSALAVCLRWPKDWSFSFNIGPSNEYSWFISFRIDFFGLLAVQGTLKSLLQHQFKNVNSLAIGLHCGPTLASTHGYWKNHSFGYMDLRW